jgi:FkbM family methyltransferase
MTGATGNIYCGLHEYPDMSFLLHLLRPGDLFADVGANVGSYTVLASAVCRARSVSVEPDPGTMLRLRRNVALNCVDSLVRTEEVAVGAEAGTVGFTVGLDTVNRVSLDMNRPTRTVKLAPLDHLLANEVPLLIKLDVEGFETEVLKGAERTLADPGLAAVLAEDDGAEVGAVLARHGFVRAGYLPLERRLVPPEAARGTNGLFVRRRSWIEERVASAPTRRCGSYLV